MNTFTEARDFPIFPNSVFAPMDLTIPTPRPPTRTDPLKQYGRSSPPGAPIVVSTFPFFYWLFV